MASSSFGGAIKMSGESEYRSALKQITSSLKEVSSELKLTNVQFVNGDKTLKETKTEYGSMNNVIKEQKDKVSSLRQVVSEMEKEYGSNNAKVKQFKTELNRAEASLIDMENATDKSNKELKEMKNNFNSAGDGAVKFGDLLKANVLGDVISGGLNLVGSAVKNVASSLVDLAKESLNARGELEQQVGGIETLFKSSSETVISNANKAYKTAGLSAVEYMETATSFSASLLQSLGGDTEKVASVTDMAIIDMSDNANKMGTSMESIQNAYQGFAKQNYTMLDNLKLGYGGTKGEMERLLKDAKKVTGVKYDINNLNDVYQAIHVIQGELGITGTTAVEATQTLEGSTNALKSSWQNFLSGSGGLGDVLDSVKDVTKNVARIAKEAVPEIITDLKETLPEFISFGMEVLQNLVYGLINEMPQMITTGFEVVTNLINGIAEMLPELIPVAIDTIITLVENLLDNIDMIIDAGINLILGLADGLIEAVPRLIEKAPEIIEKLFNAIVEALPKIYKAGGELIGKLIAGITGSFFKLLEKAPEIVSTIVIGIKNYLGEIKNAGKNLVEGLWEGISGMANWVKDKVMSFASNIVGNIKEALGIHSPSAVLRDEVGKYMAEGIGVGFSDEMKNVSSDMQNAIPTEFDINSNLNTSSNNNMNMLKIAFVEAIKQFNPVVVLDNEKVGTFALNYTNKYLGQMA